MFKDKFKKSRCSLVVVCSLLWTVVVLLISGNACAKTHPSFGPITIREQNPIYLQNLGLMPTRATVLPEGTIEARLDWAYSSVFEQGASPTNQVTLDMETMRLAAHVLYGFTSNLEVGIELPFYHSGGGFLDSFIQSFHNFFGLPNSRRETVMNNQYTYQFSSGGNVIYNVSSQSFMLGDITLRVKHHVFDETKACPALAWFADIKLPTGTQSRGTGSGAPDFGIGLALEKNYKRIHGYLNVEYIVVGGNNTLDAFMRQAMFAFAAAFEVTILDTWSGIVQLNGSSPLLANTGMETWDGVPMNLVVGFRGEEKGLLGGRDLIWQVGFSEDILSSGPSVDFTAFLSLGIRFHKPKRIFNKTQWLAMGRHR